VKERRSLASYGTLTPELLSFFFFLDADFLRFDKNDFIVVLPRYLVRVNYNGGGGNATKQ